MLLAHQCKFKQDSCKVGHFCIIGCMQAAFSLLPMSLISTSVRTGVQKLHVETQQPPHIEMLAYCLSAGHLEPAVHGVPT
mmetsp:Transcript_130770/g.260899  ORF Transcript_130770/g.260899 Transcript_130770/m.260899 type:complete len:80 (-) Transcript_130770:844-1083(-)